MIPQTFARATAEREGEAGAAWLAELPGIVAELLERWRCVPDGEVSHGGVGVIVPVRRTDGDAAVRQADAANAMRRADGGDAVLKVSFPHPGNVHEPDAFAAWGGRGAVHLYERADDRYAMLLERVRPETLAESGDVEEIATVAGRLSRRLAIPAPPGLPRLREQAGEWERELREDAAGLPHTMPARVVDEAVATARELGPAQPDLLVHGDLHPRNILRAGREPWLAVDPKGYVGDPAYDGGTLLKSLAFKLAETDDLGAAVHRVLDVFAGAAGLDRERVRRWASSTPCGPGSGAAATGSASRGAARRWTGSPRSLTTSRSC
ncbi:aminoglycoside phosphotransferase family protein [Nonomuraea sp. PA05]|uniref:aminoglycoside phosphotransferase family protein n=1 Tax=Nonomuraea sp. PA05 TaxID=2604466 RepID=UPI001CA334C9|nr:aminoglycoside phosphotransferase family protein [Nonomuraea sp. PA05]